MQYIDCDDWSEGFDLKEWLQYTWWYTVCQRPFHRVCTLVSAGYQPLPPSLVLRVWRDGKPWLKIYPIMFFHLHHVYKLDGFCGLFRGLLEEILSSFLEAFVRGELFKRLVTEPGKPRSYIVEALLEILAQTVALAVSHPLHVISLRKTLQFVGRETVYNSLWSAVGEIYARQGVAGFFAGFPARLLAKLTPCVFIVCRGVNLGSHSMCLIWFLTNLFNLVSIATATCGSGLKAAGLPNVAQGHGLWSCFVDLVRRRRLLDGCFAFIPFTLGH